MTSVSNFREEAILNAKPDINELRTIADEAEAEAQAAMRVRKDAVAASQRAMAAASKARARYLRAVGYQSEGNENG